MCQLSFACSSSDEEADEQCDDESLQLEEDETDAHNEEQTGETIFPVTSVHTPHAKCPPPRLRPGVSATCTCCSKM